MEHYFIAYTFTYKGKVFFDNCFINVPLIQDKEDIYDAEVDILDKVRSSYDYSICNVTILNFQKL